MLVPLALRKVPYRPIGASAMLHKNLFVYGIGGMSAPFVGIKLVGLSGRGAIRRRDRVAGAVLYLRAWLSQWRSNASLPAAAIPMSHSYARGQRS